MADIRIHDKSSFSCAQSKHEHLPRLPSRGIFLAPSGQFKTTAIVDLVLRHYRGCFERVVVLSPSVDIDPAWEAVKDYSRDVLGVDQKSEKTFFDEWDPDALRKIVDAHSAVVAAAKRRGEKKMFQILVIVDDFSDDPAVLHQVGKKNILNSLATRGRHAFVSLWISAQKLTTISPVIRTQVNFYCIGRLRSNLELKAVLEEISAILPADRIKHIYDTATREPHCFLYINLAARDADHTFYKCFTERFVVSPP